MSNNDQDSRLHLVFVCTGNICRSPMAEVIVQDTLNSEMLDLVARVSSCGLGGWHVGDPADPRAVEELRHGGHDGSNHRAAQLGEQHMGADLFIALDDSHRRGLLSAGVDADKIRLLRSFDPNADSQDVEDPYYGTPEDFATTRSNIEGAVPGIMDWIREAASRS